MTNSVYLELVKTRRPSVLHSRQLLTNLFRSLSEPYVRVRDFLVMKLTTFTGIAKLGSRFGDRQPRNERRPHDLLFSGL